MSVRACAPLLSVAVVFAVGAAAARAVAARHPAAISIDFAQPLVVVTAWGAYGTLCFTLLAATLACAALALLGAVRACVTPASPARPVAFAAFVALVALAAWPFVFSSDVYAYAAYGSLAAHGSDPYLSVAPRLHGPFTDAARWQWGGRTFPPCVYGPAFVVVARFIVTMTGGSEVAAALVGFRLLAGGAFVLCIFALERALLGMGARRRFVLLAAFGLNPVALWSVAEGHNDALVLLAALFGFVIIKRGGVTAGALIVGLTPLLKATGAAFALGLALDSLGFASRATTRLIAALAAGFAASVALALPPVLPALLATRDGGHYAPAASLQNVLGPGPSGVLVLAAAIYGIVRLHARERDGHAWLGIAVWLALPNPYPWYALWFLPAVLAAGGGPAAAGLYGVTISSLVRYLPDAFGHIDSSGLRLAAAVEALPLLVALAPLVRPFPFRKTTSLT